MEIMKIELSIDHLKRKSKVTFSEAFSQIIWNSLDADADNIDIIFNYENTLDRPSSISIMDDGVGLQHSDIKEVLGIYGSSKKNSTDLTTKGRSPHGKLGEGRYTYFAIGSYVKWKSVYMKDGLFYQFEITFTVLNASSGIEVSEPVLANIQKTGMEVEIFNIADLFSRDKQVVKNSIIREFAPYLLAYNTVNIMFDNARIDVNSQVLNKCEHANNISNYDVKLVMIKWNESYSGDEMFICGNSHVAYMQSSLDDKKNHDISLYISSSFFDMCKEQLRIELAFMDEIGSQILTWVKDVYQKYREELLLLNKIKIIEDFKEEGVYPYKVEPQCLIEREQKKIFDLLTVELSCISPKALGSSKDSKRLTLNLLNESIKTQPENLKKIINEVFKLDNEKQKEFAELLNKVSLSNMISSVSEVVNRLSFLDELTEIIYNGKGKRVKERTQFQPLLLSEIWIFGDKYRLGCADNSLRNVLKAHQKEMGETKIELDEEDMKNTDLSKIPDIILWNNQLLGDDYENLVVEIKRPTKILGSAEISQITRYARIISNDPRFDKEKTKWRFILVGNDFDEDAKFQAKSNNGILVNNDNIVIEIMKWSTIIQANKKRLNYFKEKMNLNLSENELVISLNNRWEKVLGRR